MEKIEMNLIRRLAWSFMKTGLDIDDLIGEASLAYTIALDKFNPDKGTKFTTFAYWCIKNHLITYVSRKKSTVGFGQPDIPEAIAENTTLETLELIDLIESLKPKAKKICEVILKNPDMFTTTTREGMRAKVVNYLREQGWDWHDIRRSFGQIKWALNQ